MARPGDHLWRLAWGGLFALGFVLSPISWWNDALVNLPIACLAGQLLAAIFGRSLFLGAFIGAYWATNLAGLLLMHLSARKLLRKPERALSLWRFFLISLIYTLAIIVLAQFEWIQSPLS
ncbi:MAG: hypothetical protein HYV35_12905 [Lentisphaerae bacterium]|nr:hypothetical protein [Lentisphaerota bacterium]